MIQQQQGSEEGNVCDQNKGMKSNEGSIKILLKRSLHEELVADEPTTRKEASSVKTKPTQKLSALLKEEQPPLKKQRIPSVEIEFEFLPLKDSLKRKQSIAELIEDKDLWGKYCSIRTKYNSPKSRKNTLMKNMKTFLEEEELDELMRSALLANIMIVKNTRSLDDDHLRDYQSRVVVWSPVGLPRGILLQVFYHRRSRASCIEFFL